MEHTSPGGLITSTPNASIQQVKSTGILPLPPEVIAQIKSSATITSLTAAILGLVQNSLDAGATKTTVDIDFVRGNCTIEDDGLGISPSEFAETGGLGKLYHTSKYARSSQIYGTNGTFLASLAALCLLTITSKHHRYYSTNSLIVHQSKTVSRLIPAPVSHRLEHRDHGTKVAVRDLFGNMPVRVKQRALLVDDHAELDKQWEELKSSLTALCVAFGSPVSVRIRDAASSKQLVLNSTIANNAAASDGTDASLLSSKHQLALGILHQAGKIATKYPGSWIPASASSKAITVRGMICLDPAPTKTVQYISLGVVPLMKTSHNIFYDHVNRMFSRSHFGALEEEALTAEEIQRRHNDGRFKKDGLTKKQMGVEKGVDRWPMFVLKIEFKEKKVNEDDLLRTEASMERVVQVLDALVASWLSAHHFGPKAKQTNSRKRVARKKANHLSSESSDIDMDDAAQQLPARPPTTAVSSGTTRPAQDPVTNALPRPYTGVTTVNSLSRIKSSHTGRLDLLDRKIDRPGSAPTIRNSSSTRTTSLSQAHNRFPINIEPIPSKWSRSNLRKKTEQTEDPAPSARSQILSQRRSESPQAQAAEDNPVDWVDPITKQIHKLNARTGMAMTVAIASSPNTTGAGTSGRSTLTDRRVSLASRGAAPSEDNREARSTEWIETLLDRWDNPVFKSREQPIPQTSFGLPFASESRVAGRFQTAKTIDHAFSEVSHLNASKISKAALQNAEIIGQVDEKFILVRLSSHEEDGQALLVAIDQHAADERCKVEQLLRELCAAPDEADIPLSSQTGLRSAIKTSTLDKAVTFAVPTQEAEMFYRHAAYFASWGILYDMQRDTAGSSEQCVLVRSLPPVVAERCRLEPKILISLLRSEIWKREEASTFTTRKVDTSAERMDENLQPGNENNEIAWINRMSNCPSDLLDMVNSRACRSAIMFNDALTKEQCKQVVSNLAQCTFPFQCAHGRPSMVPLIDLGAALSHVDDASAGFAISGNEERNIGDKEKDYASAFGQWSRVINSAKLN